MGNPFLSFVENGRILANGAWMCTTLWWAWVWVMFFPGYTSYPSGIDVIPWWTVFLASASLSSLLMSRLNGPRAKLLGKKSTHFCCDLALAVCTLLLFIVPRSWMLTSIVFISGFLSSIWAFQGLVLMQGSSPRERSTCTACAMLAACLLYLLLIDRPHGIAMLSVSALPLCSALLLLLQFKTTTPDNSNITATVSAQGRIGRVGLDGQFLHTTCVFLGSMTFGVFGSLITTSGPSGTELATMAGIFFTTFVVILLALTFPKFISCMSFYVLVVPLYLLGLAALILSILTESPLEIVAMFFVVTGWSCSIVFAHGASVTPSGISAKQSCTSILSLQLGTLCGTLLFACAKTLGMPKEHWIVLPMALVIVLVFVLAILALHSLSSKGREESATHEKEGASSPDKHLVELSDTYGLSDREREVFQRLLKGYSLPHVAEDMSLSKNTVATHAQHVYKKFNVHSKQELIDFVEKNLGKKVAGKMFDSKESDVRQL